MGDIITVAAPSESVVRSASWANGSSDGGYEPRENFDGAANRDMRGIARRGAGSVGDGDGRQVEFPAYGDATLRGVRDQAIRDGRRAFRASDGREPTGRPSNLFRYTVEQRNGFSRHVAADSREGQ